jgi:large subunit ribosomal protein L13
MADKKYDLVIDAKNTTLGRVASYSAKQSLLGKKIVILNCDDVLLTGKKSLIIQKYNTIRAKGGSSLKGPQIPRIPFRIVKRTIRGMLPHKKARGIESLKNITCYNDTPLEFSESKKLSLTKPLKAKSTKLKDIVKELI